MVPNRILLGLHAVSMLCAVGLFGLLCLFPQRTTHSASENFWGHWSSVVFAAVASISGVALMAKRKGQNESFLLAISMVTAFILLALAL